MTSPIASDAPMITAPGDAPSDVLDIRDFPDRDALIGYLVVRCHWPTVRVGAMFGRSDRQVRRIARTQQGRSSSAGPAALTRAEARAILNDYEHDPFITAEEREAARAWLDGRVEAPAGALCRGIEDFPGFAPAAAAAG